MIKISNAFLFLFAGILFLQSCDSEGSKSDPCSTNFNQEAMFQNMADNLIIPAFEAFQTDLEALESKLNQFLAAPGSGTLQEAQDIFKETYLSWQSCAQYNFGPAEEVFLRSSVNNFPLDIEALNANIESGSYDFTQPENYDKGLPAIDYMLFGIGEDEQQLLEKYTTAAETEKNKSYLSALIEDMITKTAHTLTAWKGDYKADFIANTGTAAGSSLSLVVNHLNQNYELIKREKLGIPSGVLTIGFTNPDKVEAFYSGISAQLAVKALQATKDFYTGGNDMGLDDYLVEINAEKDNLSLNSIILAQFDAAIETTQALSDPLSEVIEEDPQPVENAYSEVVRNIVNIKTDMPSVLCVSITYIDNPSDSD